MSGFTECSFDAVRAGRARRWSPLWFLPVRLRLGGDRRGGDRNDPDALLVAGLVLEAHLPVDLGEDRVVGPETGVLAGLERHPTLPDDDRPGGDELAVAGLHA